VAERFQLLLVDRNEAQAQFWARSLETVNLAVTVVSAVPERIGAGTALPEPDIVCCSARPRDEAIADCLALKCLLPEVALVVYSGEPAREVTRLRFLEAGADEFAGNEEMMAAVAVLLPGPARIRGVPAAEVDGSRMLFSLHPGEISNVVQFLSYSTRTGALVLTFTDSATPGRVLFENGQVVHVEYGGSAGVDALATMFLLGDAEGRFFDGVTGAERSVEVTTSHLLMKAAIRADECAAAAALQASRQEG